MERVFSPGNDRRLGKAKKSEFKQVTLSLSFHSSHHRCPPAEPTGVTTGQQWGCDLGGGQVILVPPNCLINVALPRQEGKAEGR